MVTFWKQPQGMSKSHLELILHNRIERAGLPAPALGYRFAKNRRWAFDFCWVPEMVALEVEGGTWNQGRHVRGKGYENDCEKYNEAAILGYTVLRCTSGMIDDGRAVGFVERALKRVGGGLGSP